MATFKESGEANTREVIELAVARAKSAAIEKIVIASSTGYTAQRFIKSWPASRLIVVRYVTGFERPNVQEMPADIEKELIAAGARIITAAHPFGGLGRAVRRKFNTYQTDEIIAGALRIFGQGVKVCCEITLAACDTGHIRTDERVITCAGTGRGADTAILVTPANTHSFFDLKVHEIICKPE